MRKKSFLSFLIMLLFAVTSCSSDEPTTTEPGSNLSGDAGKTLIVYFSWGGNTKTVANHIHDLIGGDIVEVETVIPYPDTYEEVTQIAPGELASDYRPELKTKVDNMDEYDTLIVGTPIWGGHLTPCHEKFFGKLQSVGQSHSPVLYTWRQRYSSKCQ
ncbi:flavodoxin [Phocaeicola dorei]|nr:flavodoxin [Phocaeicola dorei]